MRIHSIQQINPKHMHTIMRSIRFRIYFVNRFLPQMVVIRTLLITKPFNKINLLIQIQFYEVRVGALLYVFKHTTLYTRLVHVLLNTLIWYPHKESSAMSTIRGEFNRASPHECSPKIVLREQGILARARRRSLC